MSFLYCPSASLVVPDRAKYYARPQVFRSTALGTSQRTATDLTYRALWHQPRRAPQSPPSSIIDQKVQVINSRPI